jgi:hypothetical protein
MPLYKCSDCGSVSEDAALGADDVVRSICCRAEVAEVELEHGDGCCCRDCDPDGLVQSYYARTGRVL